MCSANPSNFNEDNLRASEAFLGLPNLPASTPPTPEPYADVPNELMPAAMSAADYISLLFESDDRICIMLLRKGEKPKHRFATVEETTSPDFIDSLRRQNDAGWDIYICMNPLTATRRVKANIACIRTLYLDIDYNGAAALKKIFESSLVPKPQAVLQSSPRKFQVIWSVDGIQPAEQEQLLTALIQEFGGDPAASDMTRVLRLPGFKNHKYPEKPIVEVIESNFDGGIYTANDFKVSIAAHKQAAPPLPETIYEGEGRNIAFTSLAGTMRRRGMSEDAIFAGLRVENPKRCEPPLPEEELRAIAKSVAKYAPAKDAINPPTETPQAAEVGFAEEPEEPEKPLPDFTSLLTGSLADYAHAWEPDLPMEFKVWAVVTKIGLALSGKVRLEGFDNLQPRFYTCLIAEPWHGKSAAIETSGFDDRELFDTIFSLDSGPALVKNFGARHFFLHPNMSTLTTDPLAVLLSPDEIKDVFEKSKSTKESKDSILTKLIRLYDSNKVGNNIVHGGNVGLTTAHFAMLGGATPKGYDGMWVNTGGGMNGMQSRITLVGTNNGPVPQKRKPTNGFTTALARDRIMFQIRNAPPVIHITEDAEKVMDEWWALQAEIPKDARARVPDIVRRYTTVLAVTNDTDTVTESIMRMGIAYGDHLLAMRTKYNPQDASSNVQAMENRIEACYKKCGDMADRELMQRVHPARYPGGYSAFASAKRAMRDAERIRRKGAVTHGQYKVGVFGL